MVLNVKKDHISFVYPNNHTDPGLLVCYQGLSGLMLGEAWSDWGLLGEDRMLV